MLDFLCAAEVYIKPHLVKEAWHKDTIICVHQAGEDLHQVAERLIEHACTQAERFQCCLMAVPTGKLGLVSNHSGKCGGALGSLHSGRHVQR